MRVAGLRRKRNEGRTPAQAMMAEALLQDRPQAGGPVEIRAVAGRNDFLLPTSRSSCLGVVDGPACGNKENQRRRRWVESSDNTTIDHEIKPGHCDQSLEMRCEMRLSFNGQLSKLGLAFGRPIFVPMRKKDRRVSHFHFPSYFIYLMSVGPRIYLRTYLCRHLGSHCIMSTHALRTL